MFCPLCLHLSPTEVSAPRHQLAIIVGDWLREVWYRQVCIFLTMPRSAPWCYISFCVTVSWQIRSRFRTAVSRHVNFSRGSRWCRFRLQSAITSASLSSSYFSFSVSSSFGTASWNAVSSSSRVASFYFVVINLGTPQCPRGVYSWKSDCLVLPKN